MTIKSKNEESTDSVNPFIGMMLLLISIVLFTVTSPLGIIYGFCYKIMTKTFNGIGEFSLRIAISIDQLGNVVMQYLLNELMIVKGGYKFGNRDETISSVIGKNVKSNKLSNFGHLINTILDFIDTSHSLNSIDYYVEPVGNSIK